MCVPCVTSISFSKFKHQQKLPGCHNFRAMRFQWSLSFCESAELFIRSRMMLFASSPYFSRIPTISNLSLSRRYLDWNQPMIMILPPLERGHSVYLGRCAQQGGESAASDSCRASVASIIFKRCDPQPVAEPVQTHVDRGLIAHRKLACAVAPHGLFASADAGQFAERTVGFSAI